MKLAVCRSSDRHKHFWKCVRISGTDLIEGLVVKRPSRHVKTPYVADVKVSDQVVGDQKEILAHSPSLGCCGLADASAVVLMTANNKEGNKCSHTICLSIRDTQIIGINPKLAEQLVESALVKNCLSSLRNVEATDVASNPLKKGSLREPFYQ
jgi:DNA-binding sugar fermentation-stimulating protein